MTLWQEFRDEVAYFAFTIPATYKWGRREYSFEVEWNIGTAVFSFDDWLSFYTSGLAYAPFANTRVLE
jgi:hypothetical protein